MALPTTLTDGQGNDYAVKVSPVGELIIAPFGVSDSVYHELATAANGYTFYEPLADHVFIITGIVYKADKQVSGTTEADLVIYESSAVDSAVQTKVLFQTVVLQYDSDSILPLNVKVGEGVWLNASTSDDDVHMTIMGYYKPA